MSKRFDRALECATDQTHVEPNWESILECVDMIRGNDVPVKHALPSIQKRYHHENPHVAHHALLVLEACVKNCGTKFHAEIANKEFMDDIKNIVIQGANEKVKQKVLELIQCWASAFRNKPELHIFADTHNLMKMNGYEFPAMKEADAMFVAESAPDWADGDSCYRCRTEFGLLTRKHHCRACGQIFCDRCSNKQMFLPQFGIEKKACRFSFSCSRGNF
jgi:growth factor-regulated tyrosine kinase substrate